HLRRLQASLLTGRVTACVVVRSRVAPSPRLELLISQRATRSRVAIGSPLACSLECFLRASPSSSSALRQGRRTEPKPPPARQDRRGATPPQPTCSAPRPCPTLSA